MKRNSPYRYVICACATGLVFVNMGLLSTAFTSYFPYMYEIKNYSNTQLYMLPTIRSISAILFTLCSDLYFRRLGVKKGCLLALIAAASGFFLLAFAPAFWVYQLVMVLFGFSYSLGATIPASVLVRQWFPEHNAGVMGIVTAGSGISFVFLPMFINHFVAAVGLDKTLLIEAIAVSALGLLLFLLIREVPAETSHTAGSAADPEKKEEPVLTRMQEFRLFIAFFIIGWLALTAVSGLSMLFSTTGHSKETAAKLVSAFGFALIVGKLLYGFLCEKIGSRQTTTLYCIFMTIGLILCCFTQDAPYWLMFLASTIFSLGACLASAGLSVIAGDMSRKADYRKMLKNLQFIYSVGGFVSGTIPGLVADHTGSYIPAYWIFVILSLLLFVLLLPLYRVKERSI